jgi:hypothetical protein
MQNSPFVGRSHIGILVWQWFQINRTVIHAALHCSCRASSLVITGNGMPVQTSAETFETQKKARADGCIELEKLIKTSRILLGAS